MPPRAAANAAPAVRQDFPWALGILGNPDADPTQLPLALNYLSTLNVSTSLPHDTSAVTQLLTLATPFVCANDTAVNTTAIKVVTRLVFTDSQNHDELREALQQPASLQALWAVLTYFHASFDAYSARLLVIQSEPPEPPTPVRNQGKPDSRNAKNPPPPPVDPETTLPGPSKYALDLAITALSSLVASSTAAEAAAVGFMCSDVAPLLTVLKHHSSRIQVLALRLIRTLLQSDTMAIVLAGAGTMGQLTELLCSSLFGAVREEVLLALMRMMGNYPPAMQLALDSGLPAALLKHVLAPTTGVPQEDPPTPPPPPPGSETPTSPRPPVPLSPRPGASPRPSGPSPRPGATMDGTEAGIEVPPGPPPIDFARPMPSSADRLQELSVQMLLQMCKHHHGAVQHLLRLGAMQLLLALLPAPKLPELPPKPPSSKRPSSASDTFIAGLPAAPLMEAWLPYIDGPPTMPLPKAPLNSHPLAASLLQMLACLLSEPGVQDYWWSVHSSKRLHLQLMYLLRTDAPPKPKPQCMLQLIKDPRWLQLAPYLTLLQQTVRQTEEWAPAMVEPMAEILQRIMQTRLPPPPRAVAASAARPSQSTTSPALSQSPTAEGPPLPAAEQQQLQPHASQVAPSVTADGAPLNLQRMCNAVANGLSQEANGLSDTDLSSEDAVKALKELAKMVRKATSPDPKAITAVAAALLVLPESAIYAPPWPPLPSPPPTPPPPPLPTSQYLWDALGRPVMTDGIKLPHL
ncbi:hypothetical protein VOLCADRAFT_121065 [Volvox carteri f. nagariensis]|uniref:Uncharacterized protein n=1 Tax=Volvox carteri f. nagariensis TaxID=3068 RepID=D8U108_VOLCA|nr:uncharacterized protein VOLCADRAFT_121065 [Volvox carteri f. nagariensis]EFJ46475.1 hypothetical protein VOLCADRAFT_121065 [Volvox carteri f. nagariensis]|eukprot:XP_002952332.1 hypothetical protein VOLCADRAFT_121065 [Volvox carteri f. nagariensis]